MATAIENLEKVDEELSNLEAWTDGQGMEFECRKVRDARQVLRRVIDQLREEQEGVKETASAVRCACGLYRWDGGCVWEAQEYDYADMAMAPGTQRFCPVCGAILTWKGEVKASIAVDFLDWQKTAKAKQAAINLLTHVRAVHGDDAGIIEEEREAISKVIAMLGGEAADEPSWRV